jgi:hypothetical protein
MLLRFFGLIIDFAERMFWVADGFTNDFQRFGHSSIDSVRPGVIDAIGLSLEPTVHALASAASTILIIEAIGNLVIQKISSK